MWAAGSKKELHRAAARGVAVHVIFDSFANLVVPRRFKRFAPIVHALEYPLLTWPWHPLHLRSYARDHRKILVVDGAMAFVGGYNTGRPYATTWRDTHARIAGPSAGEMENVFVDFWKSHRGRGLPAIPNRGFLHILYGSPSLTPRRSRLIMARVLVDKVIRVSHARPPSFPASRRGSARQG